jgi:D-3-phosphoglycerate dehydrogenase / 2-oxoglutarate reductase
MKVCFIWKNRPDYEQRIPKDLTWVRIGSGPDGKYAAADLAQAKDCDAIVAAHEPLGQQLLDALPKLRIVQRMGVGYNTVDLEAFAKKGLPVCNLGDVNKDALGEHGMALLLALTRRVLENHAHLLQVDWTGARAILDGTYELKGRTLGVLGFGKAGYEFAKRARAFGMRIVYHNRSPVDARHAEAVEAESRTRDALLREADVVAVMVSLNPSTQGLLDAKALALMKPGAYLINLARGGIVDERALAEALNAGHLAGAGLDVFSVEPITPDNPLLKAKHVVLTAHAAGTTKECTDREVAWSLQNVRRYLEMGEAPRWIVNGVKV